MEQTATDCIVHDGRLIIAVGGSRKETRWRSRELLWSELLQKLSQPTRTPETTEEYKNLPKPKRDELKDVGGFVGGSLKGGRRTADAVAWRRLVTLDMDEVPAGVDPWDLVDMVLGCAAVMYSTHSHTPERPRLRLVIPLSREVTADEYVAIARRIAGDIGIDYCDDTTFEPHRLMYWPSCPCDGEYVFRRADADWLDADAALARYDDWHDVTSWPVSSRKTALVSRTVAKQSDPCEKPGVVGAFCRVFTIDDAIDEYLSDVYTRIAEGRYTYQGGTSTGGLIVYEDGRFAYSHHGTDPASGHLCNAFDLVRIHLFRDNDADTPPGTPGIKLPSYQAMCDLALSRAEVRQNLAERRINDTSQAFDDPDDDTSWLQGLDMAASGKFDATAENVKTIMENDPNLRGRYAFDEFRKTAIVRGDLPWQPFAKRLTHGWTDLDDAGLRWYLEKTYGLANIQKVHDGADVAIHGAGFHPIRDYLNALEWDGAPRVDELLISLLGAEDCAYTRAVTRKALIGAVARVYEPGCKHDHMLVLVGPQGCGKSTTLMRLGREWFSDSLYTVVGKDACEQLQGAWIIEMGEMAATRKAEIEAIKQFISKQADTYRAAYARNTQERPRQCAFFGTTNDAEFMRDATGGRRFWPVEVCQTGMDVFEVLTPDTVGQIWAEAVVRYRAGETWFLDREIELEARRRQEEYTEENVKASPIRDYLDMLLPDNWDQMSLAERIVYIHDDGLGARAQGTTVRRTVCAREIWQEVFCGDLKNFTQQHAREINAVVRATPGWHKSSGVECGSLYGRQRGFMRSWDGRKSDPMLE